MRNISKFLLTSVATLSLAACSGQNSDTAANEGDSETVAEVQEPTNIIGVAQHNADFSTLVVAVTAADLGATLSEEGPYTVFAPTNAAFNKVDPAKLSELLTADHKADLTALLNYHVIAGKMTAADVTKAISEGGGTATLTTLQGAKLKATMEGTHVILEDATGGKSTVTVADVNATNGVIHGIDTVVMPG
ncbi:MAG: fasciclin domain-containing protein [Parasphingorhabdus sp.]|uniref:fasciclin domain-containing protein n=1 Tax=Parasphingorhabdus sp. TaxID=2709688 RepID=UPI0030034244